MCVIMFTAHTDIIMFTAHTDILATLFLRTCITVLRIVCSSVALKAITNYWANTALVFMNKSAFVSL